MSEVDLSVVVTTYHRPGDLVECLQSLSCQFDPPEQVIVVDDGDAEVTRQRLADAGLTDVDHIKGESDGLAAARNRGADAADGDVIAYVDDDAVLPPSWSRELLRTYEEHPTAAGVGGYVLNYNPPDINKADVDSFSYRLFQAIRMTLFYNKLGKVSPVGLMWAPHVFMTPGTRRVDTLQGCNMSFRAETIDEYAFHEWYGTSGSSAGEEADFGFRVSSDGGELVYNPRIVALHKRSLSNDEGERSGGPNYGNITNLTYLVLRHPDMGLVNLVLLAMGISVYSAARRDIGYLVALKEGIKEYNRHGRG